MICRHCKEKNIIKAQFCSSCGHPFTEDERKAAYDKTIFGKIRKIEDLWSVLTLDKITGSLAFKSLSLILVLGFGLVSVFRNGTQFRILEQESYRLQYNTETEEYYLFSNQDAVSVSLYLPSQASEILVYQMDEQGNVLTTKTYFLEEEIVLFNDQGIMYRIDAETENKTHSLKLRTFTEE